MSITTRIDAITGMRPDQHDPAPPAPKSVKIELTGRCNFKCAFCATSQKLRATSDMDWDFYAGRLLPMLRKAGVEEVGMFFLGESMLLPWLPKAIAEAKRQGFPYVFLTTNGASATPARLEQCFAAGLDSLKFSLNYADREQFEEVARVSGRLFDTMVDNIKAAHEIRAKGAHACGLYASYIQYDGDQGERMKGLLEKVSPFLDQVYALPLYSQADLTGRDNAGKGWDVKAGNPGRLDNMRKPVPCWSVFTEGRVTWDGQLVACCFSHDDRFLMGDLKEQDFLEAWHSAPFQALRAAHLAEDLTGTACESCVAYN